MQKGRLSPLEKRLTQSEQKFTHRLNVNFSQQTVSTFPPEIKETERENSVWEDLQTELEKRNSSLYALQRNYEGLSKIVSEKVFREEEVHKRIEDLMNENSRLKQAVNQLDSRFKVLKRQNNSLQDQAVAMNRLYEENAKLQVEIRSAKGSLELKISEISQLEDIIEKYKTDTASISKMTIESESQTHKLRKDLQDFHTRCEMLENSANFLEDEKKKLERDLQTTKSELEEQKDKYRFSIRREEELEAQILPLKKRINEEVKELDITRNKLTRAVNKHQDLLKDYEYKKAMLATKLSMEQELLKKLDLVEKQCEYLKQENVEIQGKLHREKKDRESLHVKYDELKMSSEHMITTIQLERENSQLSVEQIREKLTILEKEYEKLLRDYKALQSKALSSQNMLQSDLDNISRKVSQLNIENQELKKNLEFESQKKNLFKEKLDSVTKELEKYTKPAEKEDNAMMFKLRQSAKLPGGRSRTSTPVMMKREDLIPSPSPGATCRIDSSRAKKISSINSSLALKCRELKATNKELNSANEKVSKECRQLSMTIDDMMKEIESKNSEIKKLKHDLANNFELSRLKELIISKESEIANLRQNLHTTSEEYNHLFNLLNEEGKNRNSYQLNLELLKNIEKLKKELEYFRPSTEQLMLQLKQMREKERVFKVNIEKVNTSMGCISELVKCNLCSKFVKDAVLCIPCGHHYCKKCKKGYRDECLKCKGVRSILRLESLSRVSENTVVVMSSLEEVNRLLIS
jgi:chromosome segregation ATPase